MYMSHEIQVRYGNTTALLNETQPGKAERSFVLLVYGEFRCFGHHRAPVFSLLFTGGGSSRRERQGHNASQSRIAAVTTSGCSSGDRCPQFSTTTSLAPRIAAAISSCSATGVNASWRPQRTRVGQAMRLRSARPSGRPKIAVCWRGARSRHDRRVRPCR